MITGKGVDWGMTLIFACRSVLYRGRVGGSYFHTFTSTYSIRVHFIDVSYSSVHGVHYPPTNGNIIVVSLFLGSAVWLDFDLVIMPAHITSSSRLLCMRRDGHNNNNIIIVNFWEILPSSFKDATIIFPTTTLGSLLSRRRRRRRNVLAHTE